jgi:NADH-quinone oxidoreductase subunit L
VVLGAFVVSVLIWQQMLGLPAEQRVKDVTFYPWITSIDPKGYSLDVPFAFRVDPLSVTMILIVTGVGSLIHLYSVGYMAHDARFARYFTYLNLFTVAMLILVLANNYLLMFVGWEGVGLCSFLLIGFWFTRPSAAAAGKKAFIVNRVGDWGFILGMLLLFWTFGTLNYGGVAGSEGIFDQIASRAATPDGVALLTAAALLLFLGATGKSAQLPLYLWLPDAMEGPTPVSALIHAATMVTAGVYMVARSHALYAAAPAALMVVAVVGAATALFAALVAMVQNDIKRVLAYSTVSQLGYMVLGVGVGAYAAGIFHLVTHAFFKALLFLGAGSVMHSLAGQLDMRKMGGLSKYMPLTWGTFLVGWLAICGVPGLAGFYSKDAILANAYATNPALWVVGLGTAALTAFYMSRMFFTTFHGKERIELGDEHHGGEEAHGHDAHGHDAGHAHADPHAHPAHSHAHADGSVHVHESPPVMTMPLVLLAIGSFVVGFLLNGGLIPHHVTPFGQWLAPSVGEPVEHVAHGGLGEGALIALSIAAAVVGIVAAWLLHQKDAFVRERETAFGQAADARFGYDGVLHAIFVRGGDALSQALWRIVDVGIIDGIVNGVGAAVAAGARMMRTLQTGYVRNYALMMLIGAMVVIGALLWGQQ